MGRYVISDHHFGHANIIEYCDRPFSSVGEMNTTLLDRYYETVSAEDILNFRPVLLGTVTDLLDECPAGTRLRDVDAARAYVEG